VKPNGTAIVAQEHSSARKPSRQTPQRNNKVAVKIRQQQRQNNPSKEHNNAASSAACGALAETRELHIF
jgi:hypothetical protein